MSKLYSKTTLRDNNNSLLAISIIVSIACDPSKPSDKIPTPIDNRKKDINSCVLNTRMLCDAKTPAGSPYKITNGHQQRLRSEHQGVFFIEVEVDFKENITSADRKREIEARYSSIINNERHWVILAENNNIQDIYKNIANEYELDETTVMDSFIKKAEETVTGSRLLEDTDISSPLELAISYLFLSQKQNALDELKIERQTISQAMEDADSDLQRNRLTDILEKNRMRIETVNKIDFEKGEADSTSQ